VLARFLADDKPPKKPAMKQGESASANYTPAKQN
jgi:hypothetical protein